VRKEGTFQLTFFSSHSKYLTLFQDIVLKALSYSNPSTVEFEVEICVIRSHPVVDETELRSEENRMLSKPGNCRFKTSSYITLSVSVNMNMMVNSLKSINTNNKIMHKSLLSLIKKLSEFDELLLNKSPPDRVPLLVILTDFTV